jgi:hypothetical protein
VTLATWGSQNKALCLSGSTTALWRVLTMQHHDGDRNATFLAGLPGNCAVVFLIRPLMRQKYAFRYFGPNTPQKVMLSVSDDAAARLRSGEPLSRSLFQPSVRRQPVDRPIRVRVFKPMDTLSASGSSSRVSPTGGYGFGHGPLVSP